MSQCEKEEGTGICCYFFNFTLMSLIRGRWTITEGRWMRDRWEREREREREREVDNRGAYYLQGYPHSFTDLFIYLYFYLCLYFVLSFSFRISLMCVLLFLSLFLPSHPVYLSICLSVCPLVPGRRKFSLGQSFRWQAYKFDIPGISR